MARNDLVILGRNIGTFDSWDVIDDLIEIYNEFIPVAELSSVLPAANLVVNFNGGYFEYHDTEGNVTESVDIIDTLKNFPRKD